MPHSMTWEQTALSRKLTQVLQYTYFLFFSKFYFRYSIFVLQILCLRMSYSLSIQYLAAVKADTWAEYPPFSLTKKGTLGLLHNS